MPVRHADDRASARLQHPRHLPHGLLGLVEVLDRAHRVDRVEAGVAEGQRADVGGRGPQRRRAARERGPAPASPSAPRCRRRRRAPRAAAAHARMRVFFASSHRSVLRIRRPVERRQVLGEQALLVVRVVARRRGAAEIGKALADPGPESPIRGRVVRLIPPTISTRRSKSTRRGGRRCRSPRRPPSPARPNET